MTPQAVWSEAYKERYGSAPALHLNDVSAIGVCHEHARVRGRDGDAFLRAIVARWCPDGIMPTTPKGPAEAHILAADEERIRRFYNHVLARESL